MLPITYLLRSGWVLVIALFVPVALPAGGGERLKPQICRRNMFGTLFAGNSCVLKSSPLTVAPTLRKLQVGTPVRVLRYWKSVEGQNWMYIQTTSAEGIASVRAVRRGWVHV